MSISEGWLSFASRVPGPPEKTYSQPNSAKMYIPHSAVGYYEGWLGRLLSTQRNVDGRYTPYAAASVHGWIGYHGEVIQHYPFTVSCWASGSRYPNTNGIAFENEGGVIGNESEPLTEAQVAANVRIIQELSAWKGWTPKRPTGPGATNASLFEHRECVRWGSRPTACPSGRIPWAEILRRLEMPENAEKLLAVTRLFIEAAEQAARGGALPRTLRDRIHYLLHLSE